MSNSYIELNPWHKRQAALLYHFTSMDFLRSIIPRVDDLIRVADEMLGERIGFDSAGIALGNWRPTSTAAHFAVHAYPALAEFREGLLKSIALRAHEHYETAGEKQCSRMLEEYAPQMIWATHEQERFFAEEAERVFRYAAGLSQFIRRPAAINDFIFWKLWCDGGIDRKRIPRFRVRTDLIAYTDHAPPRTGVYVPKDDPMGALQFAWTGGYGELSDKYTLNEFGRRVLQKVGRHGLWDDTAGLYRMLDQNRNLDKFGWAHVTAETAHLAPARISMEMFDPCPCDWYFVEMVDGEYEDIDGSYAGEAGSVALQKRVSAGKLVPESGWWYSPAQGGRRYFKQGDTFPAITNSDWGDTFWLWALDQSAPSLG